MVSEIQGLIKTYNLSILKYRRLITRFIIVSIVVLIATNIHAQSSNHSFKSGEKLTFKSYYNWGAIWVYAADVEFSVQQRLIAGRPVYCFEAHANSISRYDWFFKIRDVFRSYVDVNSFQLVTAERNTSEGSVKIYEKYTFDDNADKIHSVIQIHPKPVKHDSIITKEQPLDVLSAVFNCRNIDFEKYKVNDKIPVTIVLDGKISKLYVRYLGKAIIADRKGQKYNSVKFSCLLVAGTAFRGGEDVVVWATDDQNRMPILVEAKVLVGSVKAYIEKYEGLKYPLKSLVK